MRALHRPGPHGTAGESKLSDLTADLARYLPPAEIEEVRRAYLYAHEAHRDQRRLTGEPYITHPLAVARILSQMSLDASTLEAALLHDVIEDTPAERAEIAELFGEEVARLVDGVSKLTQIRFESRREAQAENFRKMVLAMVADVRVILIKLADRLHNMRTLGVMPAEKRRRIACGKPAPLRSLSPGNLCLDRPAACYAPHPFGTRRSGVPRPVSRPLPGASARRAP